MSQRDWLLDLYRHQAWADAEHWRLLGGFEPARNDEGIRKRLHHIHMVEHAFRWIVGDRQSPFEISKTGDFPTFDALREYARGYHAHVEPYFVTLTDARLNTVVDMPWFKDPPLSISVAEALTQCAMHSQHHRGQNAARLRELGGAPENTDYIVWLWKGRPAPAW
jgi:uncharacterized damage-inducible protein DinB